MRRKASNYFEVKASHVVTLPDGMAKRRIETFCVDAMTFGEAEARVLAEYTGDKCMIKRIMPAEYREVFFTDNDGKWYSATLQFVFLDDNGKEKKDNETFLVEATSIPDAIKNIEEAMSDSMACYSSISIKESRVVDVMEHEYM